MLLFQTPQPLGLLRTHQFRFRLLCQRQEGVPMPLPNRLAAAALRQPLSGILTHRLQQPVARVSVHLLRHHQALVGERSQPIEDFPVLHGLAGADPLRRCQRPPSGKYR